MMRLRDRLEGNTYKVKMGDILVIKKKQDEASQIPHCIAGHSLIIAWAHLVATIGGAILLYGTGPICHIGLTIMSHKSITKQIEYPAYF